MIFFEYVEANTFTLLFFFSHRFFSSYGSSNTYGAFIWASHLQGRTTSFPVRLFNHPVLQTLHRHFPQNRSKCNKSSMKHSNFHSWLFMCTRPYGSKKIHFPLIVYKNISNVFIINWIIICSNFISILIIDVILKILQAKFIKINNLFSPLICSERLPNFFSTMSPFIKQRMIISLKLIVCFCNLLLLEV